MQLQSNLVRRSWTPAIISILVFMSFIATAGAQDCITMVPGTLFDTSDDCSSQPHTDRVFGSQVLHWGGTPYLVTNIGNELKIWDILDTTTPVEVAESEFRVGNLGDSDYDLENFSVCDECRYAVANFKRGAVLIDLGTGDRPAFADFTINRDATLVPGALTFMYGGQQYLVASDLVDSCSSHSSSLYEFDGIDEATDLDFIQCVEAEAGARTEIVGGYHINGNLYLGDKSQWVYLYQIRDDDPSIAVDYLSTPMIAYMIRDRGLAMDPVNGVAVEANSTGMHVWDISDPSDPVARGTIAGDFNRATLGYPLAMVAKKGYRNSEQTFDISNFAAPAPFDQEFWDADKEWNYGDHSCAEIQGAVFAPDGSALYLARYSVMQVADLSICGSGPEADFTYAPAAPAVGGPVAFSDASSNGPTSWAWDFGDGGSSTVRNPSHTYGAAGTYTVTMTARNAFGGSQATQPLVVADAPPSTEMRIYIPAAAAIAGAEGTYWRTDAQVNNRDSETIGYSIALLKRGEDNTDPETLGPFQLDPGMSVRYQDVVASAFSYEGAGAMVFVFDEHVDAVLSSRTFNSVDTEDYVGTFGQGIPPVRDDELIPANTKVRLVQLSQDDAFRTNIGFLNGTDRSIRIMVEFFLADGTSLGEAFQDVLPFSVRQWNNAFTKVTEADVADGYVDVWTSNPGGLFTVYGSVIGNDDFNDPTTVVPQ